MPGRLAVSGALRHSMKEKDVKQIGRNKKNEENEDPFPTLLSLNTAKKITEGGAYQKPKASAAEVGGEPEVVQPEEETPRSTCVNLTPRHLSTAAWLTVVPPGALMSFALLLLL